MSAKWNYPGLLFGLAMMLVAGLIGYGLTQAPNVGAQLAGKGQAAGSPIPGSTVTLYAACEGMPTQLAQGKTGDDGAFTLDVGANKLKDSADRVLYLVARGGTPTAVAGQGANDAIALLTVLGSERLKTVMVNEF